MPGWWRGNRSNVQILPPHSEAPASTATTEHPFILEFPMKESGLRPITDYRRAREHRNLTLLLNLLIAGGTTLQPRQQEGFWAIDPTDKAQPLKVRWFQQYFWAELGDVVRRSLSPPAGSPLAVVPPDKYYSSIGNDGGPLRIPEDLDDSICLYQKLSPLKRSKFDRALFWLSTASRQWSFSASSSYSSLVSAIESLTDRGEQHSVNCEICKRSYQHDAPGATANFRDFLEKYAPGKTNKKRRDRMYDLRSGILHGDDLMQLDQDRALGWDPPWWNEREIHWELWAVTKVALRNWLRSPAA
jgi:Apea-like HEPN